MESVISIQGLYKSFGSFKALNGLDLNVARGETLGFLGPNGAGKSTTIRVLLGLLRASSGHVELLGGNPWRDAVRLHRRLAYVPGDVSLWPGLTGGEAIDLLGKLRGGLNQQRRADLLKRFELDPTKKGHTYSKGNRQKVAIVAALASDVELSILDEPTSGLDPLIPHLASCLLALLPSRRRSAPMPARPPRWRSRFLASAFSCVVPLMPVVIPIGSGSRRSAGCKRYIQPATLTGGRCWHAWA